MRPGELLAVDHAPKPSAAHCNKALIRFPTERRRISINPRPHVVVINTKKDRHPRPGVEERLAHHPPLVGPPKGAMITRPRPINNSDHIRRIQRGSRVLRRHRRSVMRGTLMMRMRDIIRRRSITRGSLSVVGDVVHRGVVFRVGTSE